jgi:hypothetical protein
MQKKCDKEFYNKIKSPETKEDGKVGKYYHGHLYLKPGKQTDKPPDDKGLPAVEAMPVDPVKETEPDLLKEKKPKRPKKQFPFKMDPKDV